MQNGKIRREFLEFYILSKLSDLVFRDGIMPDIISGYASYTKSQNIKMQDELTVVKRRLNEVEREINNLS